MNTATYGGVETAQFPLNIYRPWFRTFFMVVIPLGCINYFPLHAVLGRAEALGTPSLWRWAAPAVGVLCPALLLDRELRVWRNVEHPQRVGR